MRNLNGQITANIAERYSTIAENLRSKIDDPDDWWIVDDDVQREICNGIYLNTVYL